jgi:TonB family protein
VSRHRVILQMLLCGLAAPAWGTDEVLHTAPGLVDMARGTPASAAAPLFDFDIPAQPLAAALNAYADTTGQPVLLPSEVIGRRFSAAVQGRHSAATGLQILLEGSGLAADRRSSPWGQTFVLKEKLATAAAPPPQPGMAALFGAEGYAGLVQARVWQALCADRRSRPGDYGAVLRFELEADGHIGRTRLVGSSGDARRDAALLDTLRAVRIERTPPAAIARQPLTIRIAPAGPGVGPACASPGAG